MTTLKRIFLVLALTFLSISVSLSNVYAEALIKDEYRARNINPGYCGWCCIQTLCKQQGIKEGFNIVESRKSDPDFWDNGILCNKGAANDVEIKNKLDKLGIKFHSLPTKTAFIHIKEFIKLTVEKGQGCLVVVYHGLPTCYGCHAITVVDINEKEGWYRYIDSNDPIGLYEGSLEWLKVEATGYVLSVHK